MTTRVGRRGFLAALSAIAAAPAGMTADQYTATKGTLGVAQELSGLNIGDRERERAADLVTRYREYDEAVRKVALPVETEPAFHFHPPQPAKSAASVGKLVEIETSPRTDIRRPERDEDLAFLPVTALAALLRNRRVSSIELTRLYLDRLARFDPTLQCVITRTDDLALAQAEQADREIRAGRYRGPLHGVPYGIKDLFATKNIRTTWGAKPYEHQVFDYDATVVERLRVAGAVLLAKLTSGELAQGDRWFGGRTRNPWNPEGGSGGSSAGPAAATAAGLVGFAIGTETGGSIVSPASQCGVVGLRPTYGRISRHGAMTLRWTMDKVGPIARSVDDCMLVLQAIFGPDGRDETVTSLPLDWEPSPSGLNGLRIGFVAREFEQPPSDASDEARTEWPERRKVLAQSLEVFRRAGATLIPVELPRLPADALYAILNAEAGAMFDDLVRTGGVAELENQDKRGRADQLHAVRFIPAIEYIRAQRVRTLLIRDMNALLDGCSIFLTPVRSVSVDATNISGHPALVVPAGFVNGLPEGVMITGRLYGERSLCAVGAAFERATNLHAPRPPLGGA